MSVVIETTLGDLTVDLFIDQRPLSCLNFLKLCKLKYYNFNLFHTIQHGFIAQTGDPTGKGDGGQSIWGVLEGPSKKYFQGEQIPRIKHTNPGLLSMVGMGDGMLGSQFFFTLASDLISLDGHHCIIGEVTEGVEILRLLNETICDSTYRPYRDVRITHTVVLEDPFNDPQSLRVPSRSPSPSAERLAGGRIAPDEELDETKGKTEEEIAEMIEAKEAKARATILEIVGDLPDADMAPPENVLFVCKLNPVTSDDDLEIIFSRFGKINCCEVIRDRKSGDSLQYAFIEFDNKKSCEDAYFKMDNVLIDDRRIHVDFSQSVSKIKWRGKGRGVIHMDHDGKPIGESVKSNDYKDQSGKKNGKSDGREKNNYGTKRDSRSERIHSNRDNKDDSYHRDRHYSQTQSKERHQWNSSEKRRDPSPKSSRHGDNRSQGDHRTGKNYRSHSRDRTSNKGYTQNSRNVLEFSSKESHSRRYSPNKVNDSHKYNNYKSTNATNNSRRQRSQSPRRARNRSPRKGSSKSPRRENSKSPRRQRSKSPRRKQSKSPRKKQCKSPIRERSRSPIGERSRSPRRDHRDIEARKASSNPSTSNTRETAPVREKKSNVDVSDTHVQKDIKSKKRKGDKSIDRDNDSVEETLPVKKKRSSTKSRKESTKSKKKKNKSPSESSSSGDENCYKVQHKKKRKIISKRSKKKKTKSSSSESSSSSSSDSSDSSEDSSSSSSDSEPKKKSKKKNVSKKKKYSSSSSSSASSSSSSDEFTSSSSDSGHEASRKKFKNKKSMREKIVKKKKHKK